MSWQASSWALEQKVGSPARKLVLIAIANYANDDDEAWPSHQTLARDTEQSAKSVARHIEVLEQDGLIERWERRRGDGGRSSDGIRLCRAPKAQPAAHGRDGAHQMLGAKATPPRQNVQGVPPTDCPVPPGQIGEGPRTNCPGMNLKNLTLPEGTYTPVAPKGAADDVTLPDEDGQSFEAFLSRYDAPPTASKVTPRRHWAKLTPAERRKAIEAIDLYRAACKGERPKPRRMLDPAAYLSRRIFDNFATAPVQRAPMSVAEAALRAALSPGFSGGVLVEQGSDAWAAWQAVAEAAGFPLRAIVLKANPLAGRARDVTGRYLPSQWPPSRDGPDGRQRASGQ